MSIYENQSSKMILFFRCQVFFSSMSITKMSVKTNLRIIMKKHAADSEIELLTKSI